MAENIEITLQTDECELLLEFLQESRDQLASIEGLVLQMEEMGPDDSSVVQNIFRMIHTLKGTAGFFGLSVLERMGHRVENLLVCIMNGTLFVDADVADCLLAGVDRLRRIVDAVATAAHAPVRRENGVVLFVEPVETGSVQDWIDEEIGRACPLPEMQKPILAAKPLPAPPTPEPAPISIVPEVAPPAVQLSTQEAGEPEQTYNYCFPEELYNDFLQEVMEHLTNLEEALLATEKKQDTAGDEINAAMRSFHTIKGTAGLLLSCIEDENARELHLLNKVHGLTHAAESLLQRRRNKGEVPRSTDMALLLQVHDVLGGLINLFAGGGHVGGVDVEPLLKECVNAVSAPAVDFSIEVTGILSMTVEILAAGFARIRRGGKCLDTLAKMQAAGQDLKVAALDKEMEELAGQTTDLLNILEFLGNEWSEEVENFCIPELERIINGFRTILKEQASTVKPKPEIRPEPPKKEKEEASQEDVKTEPVLETKAVEPLSTVIKVPQHRLDQLMNLVGELVVNRNVLAHVSKGSEVEARSPGMMVGQQLKAVSDSFAHIIDELQATVLAMRMMPVGHAFAKIPRMVRDLSRKLEKSIRLEMEGADIEVDKNVVEAIGEPLVHLIRNSADHGLETPEERKQAGKPEECFIRLRARCEGKHVLVEVIDDGRGIDADRIRRKVRERGLASDDAVSRMSDDEVRDFIFVPGFSTATEVTVVSGRGVGMDVVRRRIESVGGKVGLASIPQQGTTVTMSLPLTLSVHRGLEVACGEDRFYIPIEYVVETVRVPRSAVHSHRAASMVEVRGRTLRLLDLAQLMEIEAQDNGSENPWYSLVILDLGDRHVALRVDRFYRDGEYVLKNLPPALNCLPLIQGTMIMPDGRLILVLDPAQLFG